MKAFIEKLRSLFFRRDFQEESTTEKVEEVMDEVKVQEVVRVLSQLAVLRKYYYGLAETDSEGQLHEVTPRIWVKVLRVGHEERDPFREQIEMRAEVYIRTDYPGVNRQLAAMLEFWEFTVVWRSDFGTFQVGDPPDGAVTRELRVNPETYRELAEVSEQLQQMLQILSEDAQTSLHKLARKKERKEQYFQHSLRLALSEGYPGDRQ